MTQAQQTMAEFFYHSTVNLVSLAGDMAIEQDYLLFGEVLVL